MAFLKQVLVTIVVLLAAGALWIRFDDAPGRFLLESDLALPPAVSDLVSTLSPADDEPRVAATPSRREGGTAAIPLVAVDTAVPQITRDRLRSIGTGEAERSVAIYSDATGIIAGVNFSSGDEVAEGDILAVLQNDAEGLAVDRARIALEAAEQQVQRYEALLAASASVTQVQVDEVRRLEENARLDLRAAEVALARRNIVAPITGRVGLVAIDVGALVGAQTLIATVDDRARLKIVFNAPEAFVPELEVGHPVEAVSTTRSGSVYRGEISALDSRLDEASRTLRVEALIDNAEDELRPGMSFTVDISFDGEEYLSVAPMAIQWERAGPFVWIVADERAAKAPIRIIERNVDRVLVASEDLREGDTVVTEGVQQIREGIEVRIQEVPTLPAVPATPEGEIPSARVDPSERRAASDAEAARRLAARAASPAEAGR